MPLSKRLTAEFLGTFILVLGGCGAAVLAAKFSAGGVGGEPTGLGIGFLGVSLAFGLTVLCGVYALGHISGGHFNPAVTAGLIVGGRFDAKDAVAYVMAQVAGAIVAAGTLWIIAVNQTGMDADLLRAGGFATNGFGDSSPGGYALLAALVTEIVLTAVFLVVIMGATDRLATPTATGLAIGLALTLIHLISIPVTNTSVNPARSTGPALFVGGEALGQLWLFWVAPIIGAVIGAAVYRYVVRPSDASLLVDEAHS